MPDNVRSEGVNRGFHQEQPRKVPAKRSGGSLPYILAAAVIAVLVVVGAIYFINPSWLPFIGGPGDIVLPSGARIVFDGLAPEMTAGQGNSVVQGVSDESRATVIVRSARKNARAMGTTEGAYVQLKPEQAADLAGKRVQVTVWARAADSNPSSIFAIAYSNGNAGTGWVAFDPVKEIKPYGFVYKVPAAPAQNSAGNYIGIWSDVSGASGGLEVRLISIRVLD